MSTHIPGTVVLQWNHTNMDSVAKVHGGWIVKSLDDVWSVDSNNRPVCTGGYTSSMVFIPDPNHEWEIESLIGTNT